MLHVSLIIHLVADSRAAVYPIVYAETQCNSRTILTWFLMFPHHRTVNLVQIIDELEGQIICHPTRLISFKLQFILIILIIKF